MKPRRWNHPPPSGLRAGTPDRRGKRGEVMATFAMITTEPTWSIGELGLGITSRTSAPNISHARESCPISSSLGAPRGTSNVPPTLRTGTPNSATTGSGPKARAVPTSNRSLPVLRPKSSKRALTTSTFVNWSVAAVDATQSARRRWASTSVKRVSGKRTARGNPGRPAPEPRSTHCSPGSGDRIVASPSASSIWRSRRRAASWGPRKPRSTASRYAFSNSRNMASARSSCIEGTLSTFLSGCGIRQVPHATTSPDPIDRKGEGGASRYETG